MHPEKTKQTMCTPEAWFHASTALGHMLMPSAQRQRIGAAEKSPISNCRTPINVGVF